MARPRTDADALRALLAAQTHEAATDAFHTNGQVTAERLESLGRLTRLVEMADAAAARSRRRWAIPSVAIATLACASVMLFARTSSTEVALELKVSEFSFVLPTAQGSGSFYVKNASAGSGSSRSPSTRPRSRRRP